MNKVRAVWISRGSIEAQPSHVNLYKCKDRLYRHHIFVHLPDRTVSPIVSGGNLEESKKIGQWLEKGLCH